MHLCTQGNIFPSSNTLEKISNETTGGDLGWIPLAPSFMRGKSCDISADVPTKKILHGTGILQKRRGESLVKMGHIDSFFLQHMGLR